MSNNELKELFLKSKNFSFKLENYFDAYHENFKEFRNKEITFVEIGIFQGGSLEIWKKYFGDKARIIGIDINPECKKFEDDQIEIFIGDQSDPEFWKNFFSKVGDVDIILDDGSHTNLGQITTTVECVKNLKDGGILFVEDVHTSYLKKYNSSQKLSFIMQSGRFGIDPNAAVFCDNHAAKEMSSEEGMEEEERTEEGPA